MTMSTRKVRSILTGIALLIALAVVLPAPSEAGGLGPAVRDGGVMTLAWQWLSALWSGEIWRISVPAQSTSSASHAASRSTAPPPAQSGSTQSCNGDQGVCIDPNG
jgi:hypothetical protein